MLPNCSLFPQQMSNFPTSAYVTPFCLTTLFLLVSILLILEGPSQMPASFTESFLMFPKMDQGHTWSSSVFAVVVPAVCFLTLPAYVSPPLTICCLRPGIDFTLCISDMFSVDTQLLNQIFALFCLHSQANSFLLTPGSMAIM